MSDKPRFPAKDAIRVANELLELLKPYTERIEIAGSLRRQRESVGDIEILYVPRFADGVASDFFAGAEKVDLSSDQIDLFVTKGILSKRLNKIDQIAWGEKNKLAVHVASGIPVDLFATTLENWWTSLVIRTGGKHNNLMLTTSANKRNLTLNAYGSGVTNRATGKVTPATSERHVFELCGCEYAEPEFRL